MNYSILSAALLTALGLGACDKQVTANTSPVPVVFPIPAIPKDMWNPPGSASKPIGEKTPRAILVRQTIIRETVAASPVFTL
jgi:hypothetical protein